jgi:hypothetical protein
MQRGPSASRPISNSRPVAGIKVRFDDSGSEGAGSVTRSRQFKFERNRRDDLSEMGSDLRSNDFERGRDL